MTCSIWARVAIAPPFRARKRTFCNPSVTIRAHYREKDLWSDGYA